MSKVIDALLWRKCLGEPADQLPERLNGAGRALAEEPNLICSPEGTPLILPIQIKRKAL